MGHNLFSFFYIKCFGYEYVNGLKNYSDYSPNPLITFHLIAITIRGFLIIKKFFRLAKKFENADY